MKRCLVISFLMLLTIQFSYAAPAQPGLFTVTQPDGSSFRARMKGDEFCKIMLTESGEAVIQDSDSWYCYASFDSEGRKVSTHVRVASAPPSPFIQAVSRRIPYDILGRKAASRRQMTDGLRLSRRQKVLPRDGVTTRHGIVILVQFNDLKFKYTREHFVKLISDDSPGSAKNYYDTQFGGSMEFAFDISEIVTLPNGFAYYGKNDPETGDDLNAHEMIARACELADKDIDFSRYDDDGDGYADNVFIYYAGGDEAGGAGDDHIWSHQHYLSTDNMQISLDGVVIDNYACTSELVRGNRVDIMATIGTFCHEYLHTFGLPDYYDTDYEGSGGQSDALWKSTALLDSGNWNNLGKTPPAFNAVDRYLLGLSEPLELTEGSILLHPVNEGGEYIKADGPGGNEFYLFECRKASGWDEYIGGSGLLIYHVDRSANLVDGIPASVRWNKNTINCVPSHQCIDLVEASPSATNVSEVFFPRNDVRAFTPDTNPSFSWWDGSFPELAVTSVIKSGDDIILQVGKSSGEKAQDVAAVTKTVFQDAAIIQWEAADLSYSGNSWIAWAETGKTAVEYSVTAYENGRYAYVMEGLTPGKSYNVSIYFKSGGVPGKESTAASLITKTYSEDSVPYIYTASAQRNGDKSFAAGAAIPLRVYNAPDAEGVRWYLDGEEITAGPDGWYHLTASGTLRAVVFRSGGEKDILEKKMKVK